MRGQSGEVATSGLDMWQDLRAQMAGSSRSRAWREAGCWALDKAEHHLGRSWLAMHDERGWPIPAQFTRSADDLEAFSHLLELGLRLELLQKTSGFFSVRKMLKTDLRPTAWSHPLIQMEVAALAQRLGLRCSVERRQSGSSGSPADVVLGPVGSETVAEVKVVQLDDGAAAGARNDLEMSEAMNRLSFTYGVVFAGQMTERLGAEQLLQWLARLEAAAQTVVRTGRPETVARSGETVKVQLMATAPDSTFTGPITKAKGWSRTSAQFIGKAAQLSIQGGGWIRADSADGLFWASDWARKSLEDRTRDIEILVEEATGTLDSIHGVVLTSGACWCPGMSTASFRTKNGSYGLQRPLPAGRGRATFIVPLRREALGGIRRWHDLYDSEGAWLDWALNQAGLPAIAEITN